MAMMPRQAIHGAADVGDVESRQAMHGAASGGDVGEGGQACGME